MRFASVCALELCRLILYSAEGCISYSIEDLLRSVLLCSYVCNFAYSYTVSTPLKKPAILTTVLYKDILKCFQLWLKFGIEMRFSMKGVLPIFCTINMNFDTAHFLLTSQQISTEFLHIWVCHTLYREGRAIVPLLLWPPSD